MSKIDGSALVFDEEQVRTTRAFLPRLIRIIFYGLSISNNDYISRYQRFLKKLGGKETREANQKIVSDRKFLQDKHSLTFKLMNHVLIAMGLDIEAISIRTRDRITDEVRTFSTDDTVDSLKKELEKEKVIGIPGLFDTEPTHHENIGAAPDKVEGNKLFVVLNITQGEQERVVEVGDAFDSTAKALEEWLDESISLDENVEETRIIVEELKKVPVGTTVVGPFTKDLYLVTEVNIPK